jgi:TetR/AcrR family transcriptional regulator
MRKKRDAEGTKKQILESAEKLFANNGFNGTSLAEISQASGISDGLILYHFKSKEKLYREVIERISQRYVEVFRGVREQNLSPPEMMRESVKSVFDFWKTDSTYHRISLWAYLERREDSSTTEASLTAGLAAYLKSQQEHGLFPKSIHPIVFSSMIIGPVHFWFRYKTRYAEILHLEDSDARLDELFQNQISRILASFFDDPDLWDRIGQ